MVSIPYLPVSAVKIPFRFLDKTEKWRIIRSEERTAHVVARQAQIILAVSTARQPSLGRVAAVLFAMRFTDDDGHRVLSDVKSNTHTHHPLSGGWSNRLRVCCSLFGLSGEASSLSRQIHCIGNHGMCQDLSKKVTLLAGSSSSGCSATAAGPVPRWRRSRRLAGAGRRGRRTGPVPRYTIGWARPAVGRRAGR